jgi:hypothetical protein
VPEETDMQATAEDSLGETLTEEGDDFSKEEEKELDKTTDDANNASAKAKAPRIGFKHDPAEEAIMRKVELDVGVKKKKKKRNNRSKSQRGLVRPGTASSKLLILTITRVRRLDLSPSTPILHLLPRSLRVTRPSMIRMQIPITGRETSANLWE